MEEFAKQLGIDNKGVVKDNMYVIPIDDSDEFSVIYTTLDSSDLVELDDENVLFNEHASELLYEGEEYKVKLVGNFDEDIYKCIIYKKKGEN